MQKYEKDACFSDTLVNERYCHEYISYLIQISEFIHGHNSTTNYYLNNLQLLKSGSGV